MKPLLWALKAIQRVVRNWGVAIILITILIKILLFPLTHKQLVSMKKMSALQPKMEAIRAKYATKIKSDPSARLKMNEETMALYKQEGVNPAGGCLPLLLQMPILIAFYNLLSHSIELRHAPFMLWITDLSVKDPYYITPILMTLTMWLQQQMTPPTGDAAMRRVMNLMPFLMGFFFKDVPGGPRPLLAGAERPDDHPADAPEPVHGPRPDFDEEGRRQSGLSPGPWPPSSQIATGRAT